MNANRDFTKPTLGLLASLGLLALTTRAIAYAFIVSPSANKTLINTCGYFHTLLAAIPIIFGIHLIVRTAKLIFKGGHETLFSLYNLSVTALTGFIFVSWIALSYIPQFDTNNLLQNVQDVKNGLFISFIMTLITALWALGLHWYARVIRDRTPPGERHSTPITPDTVTPFRRRRTP